MHTEPPKADPPKRKRRWFQFSLRTLVIGVTIVAVQCAVCVPMVEEWQESQQREFAKRQTIERAIRWLAQRQASSAKWSLAVPITLQRPMAFSATAGSTCIAGPATSPKK
jgi:hypothetical protein